MTHHDAAGVNILANAAVAVSPYSGFSSESYVGFLTMSH
jgi:hypothetical protein